MKKDLQEIEGKEVCIIRQRRQSDRQARDVGVAVITYEIQRYKRGCRVKPDLSIIPKPTQEPQQGGTPLVGTKKSSKNTK